MLNALTLAAVLSGSAATSLAILPQSSAPQYSIIKEFEAPKAEVAIREAAPEKPAEPRLICKSCSQNEKIALEKLQDRGIKDRNALATIMGNIKQESSFVPNICEGGARTNYKDCGRGYGLIQWTSSGRYYGLGDHARKIGASPSSLEAQLSYIFEEPQWRNIEDRMLKPGRTIDDYMRTAYRWIGWGHHGARTSYAYDYAKKLSYGG